MFSTRLKWNAVTNRLSLLLAEKRQQQQRILDLTQSNPTQVGLRYPQQEILQALAVPESMVYEPDSQGLLIARQAVAAYYHERKVKVDASEIVLTASTSEAYSWLFKLLADAGDEVLIQQPGYPLFEFLAELEGVRLKYYSCEYLHPHGWHIDFDSLRTALTRKTKAIIVVSPNNPTGAYLRLNDLLTLSDLCQQREIPLIVDEVFHDFAVKGNEAAEYLWNDEVPMLTFLLNGFSKMLALPQMKLSWIALQGPDKLRRQAQSRLELIADTFLSVNTPVQQAVDDWLKLRRQIQHQILERIRSNYAWLVGQLENTPCRALSVEGGWSSTIEVPELFSEEEWTLRLLAEDNLLVHPGFFFDFQCEAFLIVSLLTPPEDFREGIQRILAHVH
jgi:hypothetical protein